MNWLDVRGVRESNLNRNLENHQEYIVDNMDRAAKVYSFYVAKRRRNPRSRGSETNKRFTLYGAILGILQSLVLI
jgi:hypothetical protein